MTEVIIYDADNTVWKLDVTSQFSIPLQFGIADVREPQNAKGTWSKTSVFEGTTQNNKAFKHIYEISGESNFNVNKKVRCVIIEDGISTFVGYCRLINIKRINNGSNDYNRIKYEVSFFGETSDLFKNINGLYLTDLDFSEYDHDYTYSNVVSSASGNIYKNGILGQYAITFGATKTVSSFDNNAGYLQITTSTNHGYSVGDEVFVRKTNNATNSHYNGFFYVKSVESVTEFTVYMVYGTNVGTETGDVRLITMTGDGYVYPMIDYGFNLGNSWNIHDFKPAIYLKTYIDKIFEAAGYTYTSDFFDSQFFKHLTIPFNKDTFQITQAEVEEREFRAGYSADGGTVSDSATGNLHVFGFSSDFEADNDTTDGNFDTPDNYDTTYFEYTVPTTGYYQFYWDALFSVTLPSVQANHTRNISTNFLQVIGYVNGTNTFSQSVVNGFTLTNPRVNGSSQSLLLTAGDTVTFKYGGTLTWTETDNTTNAYYTASQTVDLEILQGSFFGCRIVDTVINEGATINMNVAVPTDILQSDLLSSVIKTFKLFVEPGKTNQKDLVIEPRDDFYSNNIIDWTDKLDISRDIDTILMGELNTKQYILKYKSDKDAFNQNHEQYYGEVYGTQLIDIDNDFVTGQTIVEPIFSASPLIDFPVGTDRVITSIVKDGVQTQNRTASNIRLLYYAIRGTQYGYPVTYNNGGTSTTLYQYSYAGHLDNVYLPTIDLNFGFPKATYYNYGAWTDNNLYNRFHKRYIEEITGRNSKLIRMWMRLKPSDINTLDFSKLIRVDKHHLRLNKIMDYDPNGIGLTLCEFILAKDVDVFTPVNLTVQYGVDATIGGILLPRPNLVGYGYGGNKNTPRMAQGGNNYYGGNNYNIQVNGFNNIIEYGANNVVINGSDNRIYSGVENVVVFGNDTDVDRSNTTYVNGFAVGGDASIVFADTSFTIGGTKGANVYFGTYYEVDASGGNITVTLAAANLITGIPIYIKKVDSSTNTVTINPNSNETIDDSSTYIITTQYDCAEIISNGSKIRII